MQVGICWWIFFMYFSVSMSSCEDWFHIHAIMVTVRLMLRVVCQHWTKQNSYFISSTMGLHPTSIPSWETSLHKNIKEKIYEKMSINAFLTTQNMNWCIFKYCILFAFSLHSQYVLHAFSRCISQFSGRRISNMIKIYLRKVSFSFLRNFQLCLLSM